jgi:hypothetical protein
MVVPGTHISQLIWISKGLRVDTDHGFECGKYSIPSRVRATDTSGNLGHNASGNLRAKIAGNVVQPPIRPDPDGSDPGQRFPCRLRMEKRM